MGDLILMRGSLGALSPHSWDGKAIQRKGGRHAFITRRHWPRPSPPEMGQRLPGHNWVLHHDPDLVTRLWETAQAECELFHPQKEESQLKSGGY